MRSTQPKSPPPRTESARGETGPAGARAARARRLAARLGAAAAALALAACGGRPGPGRPGPERGTTIARPLEVYQQLGLLAGSPEFPVVASFATLAGPSDSTYVLFGLSLPNSALRFQREGQGFVGEYAVALTFTRDSVPIRRLERREAVRIPSFAETGRTEESVIFQDLVALPPGTYVVAVEARDALGSRGFRAQDTLEVPAYGAAGRRLASPIFVYRAGGRPDQAARPQLIANPRHTIPYGTDAPRLYLEAYGVEPGFPARVRIVDDAGTEVWQTAVEFRDGTAELRHALVEVPAAPLPLGRFWVELLADTTVIERAPLVVTISDQWMVANFDEVLEFLTYIASDEELDSLRQASGAERRQAWERFWQRRDPVPATPMNEYREEFFERVRIASDQFAEPGRPGWRTDRGEVFIVLGTPDQVLDRNLRRTAAPGGPSAIVWIYERTPTGRLELVFEDRTGFGRYELTPSSKSAFRAAANRLRPGS